MKWSYFTKKIKDVSWNELAAAGPMFAALLVFPFFKRKYKDTWLICEEPGEARDNGYHFFKYLCEQQPQQKCYYAIRKKSPDYQKVAALGRTVEHGSIFHWILYFTSAYNISSQKGGKPNAALCSFFELNNIFKPKNVFLQHGITKDKNDWLMADKCRFSYFVTGMKSEDSFVREAFGYPEGIVHYTGFPRFDNLHGGAPDAASENVTAAGQKNGETRMAAGQQKNAGKKKQILIMPTWRKWLRSRSEKNELLGDDIHTSAFLNGWRELLNSERLAKMIEEYDLEVIFYPHRHMQKHLEKFCPDHGKIRMASDGEFEIQDLLISSQLLITDYSSVYFDMFYMKKPVIFYQFDEEEFRKYHYESGWFDYHDNPFGNTYPDAESVLDELERLICVDFKVSAEFEAAHKAEFALYDTKNSERIYYSLL